MRMRIVVLAFAALAATPVFADEPTVSFTREELQVHDAAVKEAAIADYLHSDAVSKAAATDAKINAAFAPPARPAATAAPGAKP